MTDLSTLSPYDLRTLKSRVDAEWRKRERSRRKASRPKRSVKRTTSASKAWRDYLKGKCCANCGRKPYDAPPEWFRGLILLERAHFVHSGTGRRIEDVRLVVTLCSACHSTHHGKIAGAPFKLTDANLVWLKRELEPENYSPEFIAKHNGGKRIEPEAPEPQGGK